MVKVPGSNQKKNSICLLLEEKWLQKRLKSTIPFAKSIWYLWAFCLLWYIWPFCLLPLANEVILSVILFTGGGCPYVTPACDPIGQLQVTWGLPSPGHVQSCSLGPQHIGTPDQLETRRLTFVWKAFLLFFQLVLSLQSKECRLRSKASRWTDLFYRISECLNIVVDEPDSLNVVLTKVLTVPLEDTWHV